MKWYLIFISVVFFSSDLCSQNNVVRKNYKSTKTKIKIRDTLNLNHNGIINSKIDTLYFRNLNTVEEKGDSIWHDVVSIIGILLAGFLGWLSQFFLKGQEKNVNSHNLKEGKRIHHLEQVSSIMNNLALCDAQNSPLLLSLTSDLRNYLFNNSIYIDNKYEKIINNVCDYYSSVSSDYRMKDLAQELDFMNQFKTLFNR